MADTDTANNMFSAYGSIFDAATADNVGVRDRALSVAQLQPGRATVYGAHQAGGMLMQNLAGMAGMKTAEQQKAETITSIMKESQGLDPSDPQSARLLAQKFIQAGLPGIGQKFLEKARTQDLELQKVGLDERRVTALETSTQVQVAAEERAGFEFGQTHALANSKFDNLVYQQDRYFNLDTDKFELAQAQQDYKQVQDGILNELRNGELDISKARSALEQNDFEFRQARALVTDAQWKDDYEIKKLLADADVAHKLATTDGLVLANKAFTYNNDIRNANIEAQTEAQLIENKLKEKGIDMPPDGMFIKTTNNSGGQILQKYDVELGTYVTVTDPKELESGEYGLTASQARVYDRIWDQYKQKFYITDKYGEGSWKEDTPEFLGWAENNVTGEQGLDIIRIGQGGTKETYNLRLEENFNNEQITDGSQVAAIIETSDVDGNIRKDVKVQEVNIDFLGDKFNINKSEFNKVPPKIDGKENKLTHGQIITKLMMEGKEGQAEEYASSLEGQKVEMTGREEEIKQESENWTLIKIGDSRYQGSQAKMDKLEEKGEIKKINGQWYTNRYKK